ncbi:hypothetical protein B7486_61680, partial [cyanobacterium TDX16]
MPDDRSTDQTPDTDDAALAESEEALVADDAPDEAQDEAQDEATDAGTEEEVAGAGEEPPPLALPLWKLVAGGVAVVVVVLLAVGAAVVLLGDDEDDGGGGGEQVEEASVVDSFDRADAPNELGATESGQP